MSCTAQWMCPNRFRSDSQLVFPSFQCLRIKCSALETLHDESPGWNLNKIALLRVTRVSSLDRPDIGCYHVRDRLGMRRVSCTGIATVAFDLRGHGCSGRLDGLDGYTRSFDDYINDLKVVLQTTYGGVKDSIPIFCLGESMGAAIVLSLLSLRRVDPVVRKVTGYVLLGPVIRVNPKLMPPPLALLLLRCIAGAFPKCAISADPGLLLRQALFMWEEPMTALPNMLVFKLFSMYFCGCKDHKSSFPPSR
jgi:hypothetical protein